MRIRKFKYFVGDFETTVYKGQEDTLVWASAVVPFYSEDVQIHHSIGETFDYLTSLKENVCIYYHNLKFDGSFWMHYLLSDLHLEQAGELDEKTGEMAFYNDTNMPEKSFKYSISDKGQWYHIIIKWNYKIIEIRDSLKLLPFSVKKIGDSFGTKHKKLEMEYAGLRYPGCEITDEEKAYIANDVLVVKEALEIMFEEGHNKLTIGSCCLAEYKKTYSRKDYEKNFPNVYDIPLDESIHKYPTAGHWILKSYRGGWCYAVPEKTGKILEQGFTADVNSLYPSMMSSESGNIYPIGEPHFWVGDEVPLEALLPNRYFFVRIKTRFKIKPNKLPFIQIKGNILYKSTQMLTTSDIYNPETGEYCEWYVDGDGNIQPAIVEMTMTMTDYQLFLEHYDVEDFEIIDGCWFIGAIGLFDEYIDKYRRIKMESKGAKRELAKLFLNNLYGKMASSMNSSYKVAYLDEDNTVRYYTVEANDKKPGYIPVGTAITSYARNFTIRAAQMNYYGPDKCGFVYADTDSIHCDLPPEKVKGITIHPVNFCCWKMEACWDYGIFARQKTYIEHVIMEDMEYVKPYFNIKCAGMPDKCKKLFEASITGLYYKGEKTEDEIEWLNKLDEEAIEFIKEERTLNDFKVGLQVPGKLMPKTIRGGVLLVEDYYTMRRV